MENIYRFLVGGLIVSLFAAAGDVLKPKSFAGLFGAAPSVALATISLTVVSNGTAYASLEARSMIAGAIALVVYACTCKRLIMRFDFHAGVAATLALAVWISCAFAGWWLLLRERR
jgi:hypothetical protein